MSDAPVSLSPCLVRCGRLWLDAARRTAATSGGRGGRGVFMTGSDFNGRAVYIIYAGSHAEVLLCGSRDLQSSYISLAAQPLDRWLRLNLSELN